METLARNTLRGSFNTLNGEKQLIPTIPSLVAHLFLMNLRDVNLLKDCRLVCQSWNIDATFSLKVCSKVCLLEGRTNFNKLKKILFNREFENLPSPFQNFEVKGTEFVQPVFIKWVVEHEPNIAITSLRFDLRVKPDECQLGRVLAANQNTITNLTILGSHAFYAYYSESLEKLLTGQEIKMRALKRLKFQDCCRSCDHVRILNPILSMCKLEKVELYFRQGEILISVLTPDRVENLKHLVINLKEISLEVLNHLSNLKFQELKSLTFEVYKPVKNDPLYIEELGRFYENVSPFLKDFETNVRISNTYDLRFSNLEKITLQNITLLSALNPDSFPRLSKVWLQVSNKLPSKFKNEIVPHHGVDSFVISVRDKNYSVGEELLIFLTYLNKQFPKVSKMVLRMSKFNRKNLEAISESFPKLKTLGLNGRCEEISFFGFDCPGGKKLERSCVSEKSPRQKPIMNFKELESILLYKSFQVHPYIMIQCFPNVPKLREISLHWNQYLTRKLLRESIGHLETVCIYYSPKITLPNEITELSKYSTNFDFRRELFWSEQLSKPKVMTN